MGIAFEPYNTSLDREQEPQIEAGVGWCMYRYLPQICIEILIAIKYCKRLCTLRHLPQICSLENLNNHQVLAWLACRHGSVRTQCFKSPVAAKRAVPIPLPCSSEAAVRPDGKSSGSGRSASDKDFQEYNNAGPYAKQQGQQDMPHPSVRADAMSVPVNPICNDWLACGHALIDGWGDPNSMVKNHGQCPHNRHWPLHSPLAGIGAGLAVQRLDIKLPQGHPPAPTTKDFASSSLKDILQHLRQSECCGGRSAVVIWLDCFVVGQRVGCSRNAEAYTQQLPGQGAQLMWNDA
eukprot:1137563-Pelagomonas_calceolata.AAC.8